MGYCWKLNYSFNSIINYQLKEKRVLLRRETNTVSVKKQAREEAGEGFT